MHRIPISDTHILTLISDISSDFVLGVFDFLKSCLDRL